MDKSYKSSAKKFGEVVADTNQTELSKYSLTKIPVVSYSTTISGWRLMSEEDPLLPLGYAPVF